MSFTYIFPTLCISLFSHSDLFRARYKWCCWGMHNHHQSINLFCYCKDPFHCLCRSCAALSILICCAHKQIPLEMGVLEILDFGSLTAWPYLFFNLMKQPRQLISHAKKFWWKNEFCFHLMLSRLCISSNKLCALIQEVYCWLEIPSI